MNNAAAITYVVSFAVVEKTETASEKCSNTGCRHNQRNEPGQSVQEEQSQTEGTTAEIPYPAKGLDWKITVSGIPL